MKPINHLFIPILLGTAILPIQTQHCFADPAALPAASSTADTQSIAEFPGLKWGDSQAAVKKYFVARHYSVSYINDTDQGLIFNGNGNSYQDEKINKAVAIIGKEGLAALAFYMKKHATDQGVFETYTRIAATMTKAYGTPTHITLAFDAPVENGDVATEVTAGTGHVDTAWDFYDATQKADPRRIQVQVTTDARVVIYYVNKYMLDKYDADAKAAKTPPSH